MRRVLIVLFPFSLLLNLYSCKSYQAANDEVIVVASKIPQLKERAPEKKIEVLAQEEKKIEIVRSPKELKKLFKQVIRRKSLTNTAAVLKYCKKVDRKFLKMGWGRSYCDHFNWIHVRDSVLGDPLIWAVYGDEKLHKEKKFDTTMIFCGVHGDEITPMKFCFDILYHMERVMNDLHHGKAELKNKMIVIAPMVNPDSFFKRWPTRTNARKVDINRNFPTRDWKRLAQKMWKGRYRSDKRRNPGKKSLSEPEVLFQMNLIRRYKPSKIISIHAPLTILDYDGPRLSKNKDNHIAEGANQLLIQMSKQARGYRIKNYPFFPGSLGNWAGNERKIPTYTLELPTSDNRQNKKYWKLFKEAIHSAILHDFKKASNIAKVLETTKDKVN